MSDPKKQVKHTPEPWFYQPEALYKEQHVAGRGPCVTSDHAVIAKIYGYDEVAKSNAAFIVRAANCHEELLEACSDAVRRLIHFGSPADQPIIDKLKAAIAKAEQPAEQVV